MAPKSIPFNCYVIMPFAKDYAAIYADAIRPAVEEVSAARGEDWLCVRSDDARVSGSITKEIVTSLHMAELVIADLSGNNPNVFYELGVAHSAGRRTIMLAQNVAALPFDISSYRVIEYEASPQGLRRLHGVLVNAIQDAIDHDKQTNPVLDYAPVRHSDLILYLHDVQKLERRAAKEVWLIEPSLDTDLKLFDDIIRANLQRGLKYRYLVPDEASVRRQWQRFVAALACDEATEGLLEARFVEKHLIESEVVIYDAYSDREDVLLMSPRETPHVFWYRVGPRRGEDIRDRYEALWDRASKTTD
ncbi:MAG TPA: hypothetical protein VHB47_25525 [Thermoanaerobaculia bacterium]|jgi:hypothetical protein|nr:hypothetical protein [Thermoanaerobaculia bacterium]